MTDSPCRCSIVLSTRNKHRELDLTLASIFRQKVPFAFEVIVVDDGSTDPTVGVCRRYPVKYYRLQNPRYRNPSVARNVGYRAARGEVVIAQSDDIVHLTPNAVEFLTTDLKQGEFLLAQVHNYVYREGRPYRFVLDYCSPKRHVPYFFLGALWRKDLYAIGGNDEEFVEPCFDDNWLTDCLTKGLKLRVRYTDEVRAHHISHPHGSTPGEKDTHKKEYMSRDLYRRKVLRAKKTGVWISSGGPWPLTNDPPEKPAGLTAPKARPRQEPTTPDGRIPRRMSFYWTAYRMSWMRYLTLHTFRYHHPDWEMVLYRSRPQGGNKRWVSSETQDCDTYDGPDHTEYLDALGVETVDWTPPFDKIAPAHACDLCQWEILNDRGGFYSDMDILYVRPVPYDELQEADVILCPSIGFMAIGFMAGRAGSRLMKDLYASARDGYDATRYQSTGAEAVYRLAKVWPNWGSFPRPGELAISRLRFKYANTKIVTLPDAAIYPWTYLQTDHIFKEEHDVPAETIGIHWFGGNELSQEWNHHLIHETMETHRNTFTRYGCDADRATRVAPPAGGLPGGN